MKSMTYGTLPPKVDFKKAFAREVPDGVYEIRNDRNGRSGDYDADALYDLAKEQLDLYDDGNEEAGDFVSAVMTTLGFEWI